MYAKYGKFWVLEIIFNRVDFVGKYRKNGEDEGGGGSGGWLAVGGNKLIELT